MIINFNYLDIRLDEVDWIGRNPSALELSSFCFILVPRHLQTETCTWTLENEQFLLNLLEGFSFSAAEVYINETTLH